MNIKNLFWIVPVSLALGLLFGFSSSVYIAVPEKVIIEMGYQPETLSFMEKMLNCSGLNRSKLPEPVVMNVTIKEAENIAELYGVKP